MYLVLSKQKGGPDHYRLVPEPLQVLPQIGHLFVGTSDGIVIGIDLSLPHLCQYPLGLFELP